MLQDATPYETAFQPPFSEKAKLAHWSSLGESERESPAPAAQPSLAGRKQRDIMRS